MNNTLFYVFGFEGGLLLLAILLLVIYEVSTRHPQVFQVPKITLPKMSFGFKLEQDVAKVNPGFWDKLRQDAALIWKPAHPEFYISPDGNTLYLSLKYTDSWSPYQVVLYMLSQKQEFIDQLKTKDPTAFEAINDLVTKLTKANIVIAFKKMNILPSFQKNLLVWKLPLVDIPEVKLAEDVIVKEL
ncbi:MAG: hypothetical protein ACREHC_06760 [Candidatus Levyibacteriota bacterium]